MISQSEFRNIVSRANLAPSIHNAQPTRWRLRGDTIEIAAALDVSLPFADPTGESVGLSCGAAVEATVISLPFAATVHDLWCDNDLHTWPRHRMVARITVTEAPHVDPLSPQLEQRFTWRGPFEVQAPLLFGWSHDDAILVMDYPTRNWIAGLNDTASLGILRQRGFRQELLSWMRLSPGHGRYRFDGLSLAALRMDARMAKTLRLGFGPLWSLMDRVGRARAMTAEADVTITAPILACFHRPKGESAIRSGRAYLRLCLEASHLGLQAWPMAALTDDASAAQDIADHLAIGPDRKLVQVLRFGQPTGEQTPRARRPLDEIIAD